MAKQVDERVVKAQFDNSQFDKKIEESMKTLEKFKESLNLEDSAKGFEELGNAAKAIDMSNLAKGVDALAFRFSTLGERLHNGINKLIDKAEEFTKKFTIDPVKMGLSEYEEKMDSIKVAMANTGRPLEDVKNTLEELNEYADRTIYKFGDMTKNLGTFTAQGVELEDAAAAIKGISNLAAITGASAESASRAMYNFSQSLSMNKMELRDWRTMENTGMGNERFRKEVIQAAKDLGYFDKEWRDGQNHVISGTKLMTEAEEAFRETLKYGWFDKKLQLEVLKRYSGDYVDELTGQVYEIGQQASKAATEITTFSKLVDTVQESFQSGWAQVWESIIGDYNEAKAMWTAVGAEISSIVDGIFGSRKIDERHGLLGLLADWQDLGGRIALLDTFRQAWENLKTAISAFKDGFQQIFPAWTGQSLMDFTMKLNNMVRSLTLSENGMQLMTIAGKLLGIVLKGLGIAIEKGLKILKPIAQIANILLGLAAKLIVNIYDLVTGQNKLNTALLIFHNIIEGVKMGIMVVVGVIASIVKGIWDFISKAAELPIVQTILEDIRGAFERLGITAGTVVGFIGIMIGDLIQKIMDFGSGKYLEKGMSALNDALNNFYWTIKSGEGLLSSFFGIWKNDGRTATDKMVDFGTKLLNFDSKARGVLGKDGSLLDMINNVAVGTTTVGDTISQFGAKIRQLLNTGNIARAALLGLSAGMIGFTTTAAGMFNTIRRSFAGVPGLISKFTEMCKVLTVQFKVQAFVKITACIIALATAIALLSKAVNPKDFALITLALAGLTIALARIGWYMGILSSVNYEAFDKGANALLKLSGSMLILTYAMSNLNKLEVGWGLAQRLGAVVAALVVLTGMTIAIAKFCQIANGFHIGHVTGPILAITGALFILVEALRRMESLDLNKIQATLPTLLSIMVTLGVVAFAAGNTLNAFAGLSFVGIVAGMLLLVAGFQQLGDVSRKTLYNIEEVLKIVGDILEKLMLFAFAITVMRTLILGLKAIKDIVKAVQGVTSAVSGPLNTIAKGVKNFLSNIHVAFDIAALAGLIAVIAIAIAELGKLPIEQVNRGLNTVAYIAAGILGVMGVLFGLELLLKHFGVQSAVMAAEIGGLALVIGTLALVVKLFADVPFESVNWKTIIAVLGAIVVVIGLTAAMLSLLASQVGVVSIGIKAAMGISALIGVTAIVIGLLSMIQDETYAAIKATGELVVVIGMLAGLAVGLSQIKTTQATVAVFGLAALLGVLTYCLYTIYQIPWDGMLGKLASAVGVVAVLAGIVIALDKFTTDLVSMGVAAGVMTVLCFDLILLAAALTALSGVNFKAIENGAAVLIVLGVTLVGLAAMFGSLMEIFLPGVLILGALAVAMAIFAGAAYGFSAALDNMVEPCQKLTEIGGDKLFEIASCLMAIGFSGVFLLAGAPGIALAGWALRVIGEAVNLVGDGLSKAGEGLKNIAEGAYALANQPLDGLATNVAKLVLSMGDLLLISGKLKAFGDELVQSAGNITKASESLSTFKKTADDIVGSVDKLGNTFETSCNKIKTALDSLAHIESQVNGIVHSFDALGAKLVDKMVEDLNEYSRDQLPSSGVVALQSFTEGVEQAITNPDFGIPVTMGYIVEGFSDGADQHQQEIFDVGVKLGQYLLDGLNSAEALDINTPSKAIRDDEMGMVAEGFDAGVEKYHEHLRNAGKKTGTKVIDGVHEVAEKDAPKEGEAIASAVNTAVVNSGDAGEAAGKSLGARILSGIQSALAGLGDLFSFGNGKNDLISEYQTALNNNAGGGVVPETVRHNLAMQQKYMADAGKKDGQTYSNNLRTTIKDFMKDPAKTLANKSKELGLFGGLDDLVSGEYFKDMLDTSQITEQVTKATEDAAKALGDLGGAAGGAGGAAKGAAKELDGLATVEEQLYMSTDTCLKEYAKLYEQLGITDAPELAQHALQALGMTAEEFGEKWKGVYDKVKSAMDNIFDAPKDRGFIDKSAVLSNMRENINQVSQWADTLGKLGAKAGTVLSVKLYDKLAQMGPEGYKYVHAFSEMTDEELQQASEMFQESLTMPTAAANRVSAGYLNAGVMAIEGLRKGLSSSKEVAEVEAAGEAAGEAAIDGVDIGAGVQSPSWKAAEAGDYVLQGLAIGLSEGIDRVLAVATLAGNQVIEAIKSALLGGGATLSASGGSLESIGRQVIEKIAAGMVSSVDTLDELMLTVISNISEAINTKAEEFHQNGSYICEHLVEGFKDEMANQEKYITDTINLMYEYIVQAWQSDENKKYITDDIVKFFVDTFCEELLSEKTSLKTFEDTLNALANFIVETMTSEDGADSMKDKAKSIGIFWVAGIIEGIDEMMGDLEAKLTELGEMMEAVTMAATGEHSPSKITEKIGEFWDEGLAVGIKNGKIKVKRAIDSLASYMTKSTYGSLMGVNSEKLLLRGVQNSVTVFNSKAKANALSTNTTQIKKIMNDVATAFVPVSLLADEAAEGVTNAVSKIKFNIFSSTKPINKQINKAIKFVNEFDDSLARLDIPKKTIETLTDVKEEFDFDAVSTNVVKNISKINKYFSDFNQAPKKVIRYLDKLKASMSPVNNLIKKMTKLFYNQTDQFNKHTAASNKARVGMLNFGRAIMDSTDAGKEYLDALEKMEEAEEALREAEENPETKEETLIELTEAYEEAANKVPDYIEAVSAAIDEYREKLILAFQAQNDLWSSYDRTSGYTSPASLVSNMASRLEGWGEYKDLVKSLATKKTFSADFLQSIFEEGLEGVGKLSSLDQLSDQTALLLSHMMEKAAKKAKKAAKVAVASLSELSTGDVEKRLKEFTKSMNDGDKVIKKIFKGNIQAFSEFLGEYKTGSKEMESALTHLNGLFADQGDAIDVVGQRYYGLADASKDVSGVTGIIYDAMFQLIDVFDINTTKTANYAQALIELNEKLTEYGQAAANAKAIGDPFEKLTVEEISVDQALYNVNNTRQLQKEYDELYNKLVERGVAPEVLMKMEQMGLSQGVAYGRMLNQTTEEQFGGIMEIITESIKWTTEQETKAKARLIEAMGPLSKEARKAAKEAFEKNGVEIPIMDPSEAKEQGEEAGESFEEGFNEKLTYMEVDGAKDGITNALPELKTVAKETGEKTAKSGIKSASKTLESDESTEKVANAVEKMLVTAADIVGSSADVGTPLMKAFENISDTALEPLTMNISRGVGGALKEVAENDVKTLNDAITKLADKIKQIPKEIYLKVNCDYSQVDAAINRINSAKSAANDLTSYMNDAINRANQAAYAAQSALNASKQSSSSKNNVQTVSGSSSSTTNYNFTYNSPKALDLVETRRATTTTYNQLKQMTR